VYINLITIGLLLVYLGYFLMISYQTYYSVSQMKKNYRIVFYYSFLIAVYCTICLILFGYKSYGHRSIDFVALYALFNIYVMNVSFLYSPTWEGFVKIQLEQEQEHRDENNSILDNFYKETELTDLSSAKGDDQLETDREMVGKQTQQRHFKKDPQQKAKDKVWDMINAEVGDGDDDDVSSEEEGNTTIAAAMSD